jgi:ubiquinone/menaquinone biosynthesis C-methylase UbiE
MNKTDLDWEKWGQQDPYFGVITDENFRKETLREEGKRAFFESGQAHVDHILKTCRKHFDENFSPKQVLDFGCGVGRTIIPFSQVAPRVTGLDVAESMLKEAAKNCEHYGISNITLLKSDDHLSRLNGTRFDLIHSYIVFQHIPRYRVKYILKELLTHLETGGIGALHFTYAKDRYAENFGLPPTIRLAPLKGFLKKLFQPIMRGILSKNSNALRRVDPDMQMNSHNLNEVLFLLQYNQISNFYAEFTDHGGELGILFLFQKTKE